MSKARAVFFDIDHTLFSHTLHDVPASAYTALEKLKQNGSQIALCTSRAVEELVNLPPRLTDLLDGYIARSRNLITNFGKFMDPIADKLLTHTAFIMLTAIGRLNVTACIIFIAREFVVSGLRLCAVEQGHVIAAGMSGKIKTVLQMMLVVVLTITGEGLLPALLTIAASVMTLYSMGEYVWQNRAVLSGAK